MRAAGWRGAGFLFLPGAGGVRGFQRCCAGWVAQRSKKKYKNAPESYLSMNIFFFLGSQQNPSDEQVTEAKPESSVLPLCHKPYTYHQLWPEVMFLAHITPKKQIFRCKPPEGNPLITRRGKRVSTTPERTRSASSEQVGLRGEKPRSRGCPEEVENSHEFRKTATISSSPALVLQHVDIQVMEEVLVMEEVPAALQLSSLLHQESTEACVVPILDEATRLKHPAEDEDLPELEKARTKTTKAAKPRCTNTQHLHVLFAQLHVSPQDPGAFIPLRALPKGLHRRKTIHSVPIAGDARPHLQSSAFTTALIKINTDSNVAALPVKYQREDEDKGFPCLPAALAPRHTSAQFVPPPGASFGDVEMGLTQQGDTFPGAMGTRSSSSLPSASLLRFIPIPGMLERVNTAHSRLRDHQCLLEIQGDAVRGENTKCTLNTAEPQALAFECNSITKQQLYISITSTAFPPTILLPPHVLFPTCRHRYSPLNKGSICGSFLEEPLALVNLALGICSPYADVTNYHLYAVFYPMVAPRCWQRLGLLALDTNNEWRAGKSKATQGLVPDLQLTDSTTTGDPTVLYKSFLPSIFLAFHYMRKPKPTDHRFGNDYEVLGTSYSRIARGAFPGMPDLHLLAILCCNAPSRSCSKLCLKRFRHRDLGNILLVHFCSHDVHTPQDLLPGAGNKPTPAGQEVLEAVPHVASNEDVVQACLPAPGGKWHRVKWDTSLTCLDEVFFGAIASLLHLQDSWQDWVSAAGFPVTAQEDEEICLLPDSPYRQAEKYQNSKTLSEVREDPVGIKDEQALKLIFLHQTKLSHASRDHKELNLHGVEKITAEQTRGKSNTACGILLGRCCDPQELLRCEDFDLRGYISSEASSCCSSEVKAVKEAPCP
ncbi:hypothetical protein Anapl_08379 [Anas platyrhynchos]|uniref:Uncharacterized protein n=1 Tax=Anas platyrhynchos TaxID=8839 RepID=R0LUC4_ANAPL|nr:hypothetical protein Anapl_08379 [Anas platyrhynchos]